MSDFGRIEVYARDGNDTVIDDTGERIRMREGNGTARRGSDYW